VNSTPSWSAITNSRSLTGIEVAALTTDVEKLVQKFNVTWIDDRSFTKLIDSFLEYKFSEATLSHYREALRRQFGHEKYNYGLP